MTPFDSVVRVQTEARSASGARWFYWIAALSLITSLVILAGSNWVFFVSLGVTQVVAAVARKLGGAATVVAIVFDVVAAGVFALLGYFAVKQHRWAFIVGLALYALDALLFLLFRQWLALAFHAYVIYCLFAGYRACARLAEMNREAAVAVAPAGEAAGV